MPVLNPSLSQGSLAANRALGSFANIGSRPKGFEFKNPMLAPGVSYRRSDDGEPGGFGSNEYTGDIALDAEVWNGLIAGALYQHTHRGGSNDQGVSENLNSDGFSLYAAKRFFDILNAGLSYNFATTEHRLTRALNVNLDRNSNGFTTFLGLSDRIKEWSWSSTASFTYVNDNYEAQKDLDTGRFSWSSGLGYDFTKFFTLGAAFSYNNFVFQDIFPGGRIRDDDYWTIGPRARFYPCDNVTLNLDFDTEEGFAGIEAYVGRTGVDIAF